MPPTRAVVAKTKTRYDSTTKREKKKKKKKNSYPPY